MIYTDLSAWGNHLWQSTLCAAGVWLLSFVLKKNRAALRYWLWLAASAKFLLPFSLLVCLGHYLGSRFAPASGQPQWTFVVDDIGRSFATPVSAVRAAALPASSPVPAVLFVVWILGFAVSVLSLLRSARQMRTAKSQAIPLPFDFPIPVLCSPSRLEPGVFGIRKPILLMPEGITEVLAPAQLEAILAHELCHLRRHDNLTALIHLAAETIFWFFPLLWWIRTWLIEEREQACDEEVLRLGSEPRIYAEGILKVCEFCFEPRPVCVTGVTGANLKRRIEAIMKNQIKSNLSVGKKLLLAAAALITVVGPLAIGMMNVSPVLRAQPSGQLKFDVASIKPAAANARGITIHPIAGGVTVTNMPVNELMVIAYRVHLYQISGGPPWIKADRYDISAKSENPPKREEILLCFRHCSRTGSSFKSTAK